MTCDVGDLRDVREPAALAGQRRGREQLQRGVLAAADRDLAAQRAAALDADRLALDRRLLVLPVERARVRHARYVPPAWALAMPPLGHPDAQERPLHRGPGTCQVSRLLEALFDGALGLAPRGLGRFQVDLRREVGQLGHDDDLVGPHLEEAARDREGLLLVALPDAQLPDAERREQRGVMRQDAELAFGARTDDRVDVVRVGLPLGRDDLEQEGHG